jgi:predicted house-cleaning NTP pyrophosphatase (Maf/HAM1 superfamily)
MTKIVVGSVTFTGLGAALAEKTAGAYTGIIGTSVNIATARIIETTP